MYLILIKVIQGSESKSIETLCWQGERLYSAGLDGDVVEYDLKKLEPKVLIKSKWKVLLMN